MNILFHRLFRTNKLSTAYHEAGHCVVAAIFSDKLKLKVLSVNREKLRSVNSSYNGVLNMEWFAIPDKSDYQSADHLILIALAGICSKTLYTKGSKYVSANMSRFPYRDGLLDSAGGVDDYEIVKDFSIPLSRILQIKRTTIEWSAFRWIFEYLMIDEVWQATRKIAEQLISHNDQHFSEKQIAEIVRSSGLESFLITNKQSLLKKRYPMSIQTLIV